MNVIDRNLNTRAIKFPGAQVAEYIGLIAELQEYTSLVVVETWAVQCEKAGAEPVSTATR